MATTFLIGLVGYLLVVLLATIVAVITRSYAVRILLALMFVPPTLFCLFGFAATLEPMDTVRQWSFRIGYTVLGLGLAGTILLLLVNRPSPGER